MTNTRPPALYYHDQAQRIRQMAAEAHSDETRKQFLTLAEQYERLAGQALRSAAPSRGYEPYAPQPQSGD